MCDKFHLDENSADVHFIFEEGNIKVPANEMLLALESELFKSMFYGGIKEKGDIVCQMFLPLLSFTFCGSSTSKKKTCRLKLWTGLSSWVGNILLKNALMIASNFLQNP